MGNTSPVKDCAPTLIVRDIIFYSIIIMTGVVTKSDMSFSTEIYAGMLLSYWLVGWLVNDWLVGWLVGYYVWMVGWLVNGWFVHW